MEEVKKVLFSDKANATGGRKGHVKSEHGTIDVDTMMPMEEAWEAGKHSNPEELFAAAYAVCFDGAINAVAAAGNHEVTSETTVEVDFGKTSGGFGIGARIFSKIDGVDRETAQDLLEKAHQVCPYSKATKGNIVVEVTLV